MSNFDKNILDLEEYDVGERILCYHEFLIYEGKVLQRKTLSNKRMQYFIHYRGWDEIWDEWVRILISKKAPFGPFGFSHFDDSVLKICKQTYLQNKPNITPHRNKPSIPCKLFRSSSTLVFEFLSQVAI